MGKITRRQPLPWHKDESDTKTEVSMAEADEVIDVPVNATQTSHEEFSQDIELNAECTSFLEIRCAIGIYQKKKPVQAESTRKPCQNLGFGGDGNVQISSGIAPPNSPQQAEEQFLSKVFLWVAIIFIFWFLLA